MSHGRASVSLRARTLLGTSCPVTTSTNILADDMRDWTLAWVMWVRGPGRPRTRPDRVLGDKAATRTPPPRRRPLASDHRGEPGRESLLCCSDPALSTEDIALGYKQLLQVERGWRDMKTTLPLWPVYHRLEDRIRAHVILCWLALLLIRIAETTGDTWHNLREDLQELHGGTFEGPAGMFRQRTELTSAQRDTLTALGIDHPRRSSSSGCPQRPDQHEHDRLDTRLSSSAHPFPAGHTQDSGCPGPPSAAEPGRCGRVPRRGPPAPPLHPAGRHDPGQLRPARGKIAR